MLRVGMHYARPGMVLAMPVYQPRRPGTVLLAPGIILDDLMIERLRDNNLREVWIRYPGMDFLAEYINPAVFEAQAVLTARVSEAFDALTSTAHAKLDYPRYREAIVSLIDHLLAVPKAALFVQEMADTPQPGFRHSANVCFLSILMGIKLEGYLVAQRSRLTAWNARDVTSLGVGAMMHDIGMLRLDPQTLERWYTTHDESDPKWRQHVAVGYEMVKGAIEPTAAAAVRHHHQKFDGSGFPRRRSVSGAEAPYAGQDIHIFARIIAAADIFDRIKNPTLPHVAGGGRAVPTVRALRLMRQPPVRSWIDPMVGRALLAVTPAYAPGTMVELSNGCRGVVAEWFPDDPCRPTVLEIDPAADDGTPPARKFVLRGQTAITVAKADDQDVRADNFYPASPGEFDLNLADKMLINCAAEQSATAPANPARAA